MSSRLQLPQFTLPQCVTPLYAAPDNSVHELEMTMQNLKLKHKGINQTSDFRKTFCELFRKSWLVKKVKESVHELKPKLEREDQGHAVSSAAAQRRDTHFGARVNR